MLYSLTLNESPSEKEGKFIGGIVAAIFGGTALNESPSEKEGKLSTGAVSTKSSGCPSMKVPPKRKGNFYNEPETLENVDPQ